MDLLRHTTPDIDGLAQALHHLPALRRDLQRVAGLEHAVAGLTLLSVVARIGPARVSDVAAETQVDPSVASRQIQGLQADGHVDRVADPHDGRSSLIAISAAGTAKLEAAHRRLVATIATAVEDWDHDAVAGLADGIVRLRSALADCETGAAVDPAPLSADPPVARPAALRADRPTADPEPLPADRPAADPLPAPAVPAGARHQEHAR